MPRHTVPDVFKTLSLLLLMATFPSGPLAPQPVISVATDRWGYPVSLVASTKPAKATVSIAVLQAYTVVMLTKPTDLSQYGSYVQVLDSGYQMAIDDVNSDPTLLPDVNVILKRIDGLDVRGKQIYFSGGYASSNLLAQVEKDTSVVGISGFLPESTTTPAAALAGQLNIPFCGPTQTSPSYSNKGEYPTFFRTIVSTGSFAPAIYMFHRKVDAKRVAILYTTDYLLSAQIVKKYYQDRGIVVTAWVEIKPDPTPDQFKFYFGMVSRTDSRYIIACSAPYDSADIYFAANASGLVGEKFMWTFLQAPHPKATSFSEGYGPGAEKLLEGIVFPNTDTSSLENPYMAKYLQTYITRSVAYPNWFLTAGGVPPLIGSLSYDCAKLMLTAIDKVMKQQNATPEDLASGKLRKFLTTELFASTVYNGPVGAPLTLNSAGDLSVPIILTQPNMTNPMNPTAITRAVVTLSEPPTIADVSPFIFFGGSTVPPPDGTIFREHVVNSASKGKGLLLLVLGGIGILTCLVGMALNIIFAKEPSFKAASLSFTHLICLGCILAFASAAFTVNDVTTVSCRTRLWLQVLGFALVVGSMMFKMSRMLAILTTGTSIRKEFLSDNVGFIFVGVVVGIDSALLAGWSIAMNPTPSIQSDASSDRWVCQSSTSAYPGHILLYVYNVAILLVTMYISRQVQLYERAFSNGAADTASNLTACFAALFLGAVFLPLIASAETGPSTDAMRFLIIWVVAILCVGLVIGPKVLSVLIRRREKGPAGHTKHGLASVSGISTGLIGGTTTAGGSTNVLSSAERGTDTARAIAKAKYCDLGALTYRVRTKGLWTIWTCARGMVLHYTDRVLLALEGKEISRGIRLGNPKAGSLLEVNGSRLVVKSRAEVGGDCETHLDFEFRDQAAAEEAKEKISSFMT
ncbi:periplasmic binding protein-like I [Zopfochytrium polystomum]|nr:periplasmic binding protein-like I [Zopfochytrium polystomum]